MRAIKFRAWRMGAEEMINNYCCSWCSAPEDDEYKVMQFTGTMDSNLKEIYEGDLLILNGDKLAMFEVFYHDDEARFKCCRVHYAGNRCGGYVPEMTSKNLTVIGNIYENKELL